jgi:hypothetical protein
MLTLWLVPTATLFIALMVASPYFRELATLGALSRPETARQLRERRSAHARLRRRQNRQPSAPGRTHWRVKVPIIGCAHLHLCQVELALAEVANTEDFEMRRYDGNGGIHTAVEITVFCSDPYVAVRTAERRVTAAGFIAGATLVIG